MELKPSRKLFSLAIRGVSLLWELLQSITKHKALMGMAFCHERQKKIRFFTIGRRYSPFTVMDLNIKGIENSLYRLREETFTLEEAEIRSNNFITSVKDMTSITKIRL